MKTKTSCLSIGQITKVLFLLIAILGITNFLHIASGDINAKSLEAALAMHSPVSTAYITAENYSLHPFKHVTVHGFNFGAHELVSVQLESSVFTLISDSGGRFTTNTLIVPNIAGGNYLLKAMGKTSEKTAQLNFNIQGYYPSGGPLVSYLVSGQLAGYQGKNFAPHEKVKLVDKNNVLLHTFLTDGGGNFSEKNVYTIPFSDKNKKLNQALHGETSHTKVLFTIKIGTFYPQLTPSSYYVRADEAMTFSGSGFAPNEMIELQVKGKKIKSKMSDGNGNVEFNFATPEVLVVELLEVKLEGESSNESSTRTIIVHL